VKSSAIIALSVHRITASDYPCGIVKPYLGINRNYSAILATLQITSYTLGVYIALLFTCQLHESLIKLYFKQFSIFQLITSYVDIVDILLKLFAGSQVKLIRTKI
jgi:hypothetical protein